MPLSLIVLVHRELTEKRDGHRVGPVALLRLGEERALDLCSAQGDVADDPSLCGVGDYVHPRGPAGLIGPSMPSEPDVERLSAAVEKISVVFIGERTRRRYRPPCHFSQDGVRCPSSAIAGIVSEGRLIQASNASQSLAGIVTMVRLSTSASADSRALRRMNSLRLVCACSAAASRMARSSGLTRTLRTEVVCDGVVMCVTIEYAP
jgi:hypothetical protein